MARVTYEVRVAGVVSQEDLDDMAAVRLAEGSTSTVLCGVPDQSALHGLLDRFMALGIQGRRGATHPDRGDDRRRGRRGRRAPPPT